MSRENARITQRKLNNKILLGRKIKDSENHKAARIRVAFLQEGVKNLKSSEHFLCVRILLEGYL